jgi:translocation protein SEC63
LEVTGDKIVTPGAIVKLVFSARLATPKDFDAKTNSNGSTSSEPSSDNSDVEEEDDVDILIGRKRAHNDGEPVPIPLAHVPYFPTEHKPRWWAFLADPRGNRIIVHPSVITDIGTSPRKFRIQFQAPPQVASYLFQFHVKSDSYLGTDFVQDIMLTVDDVSKLQEKIVEEIIPEGDEEGTHNPGGNANCYLDDKDEDENESGDESDESEDTDTDTDTDTDSDSD